MPRKVIRIANPLPGGQDCTSEARALDYCNKGVAFINYSGLLQFKAGCQVNRDREAESEFRANRGGVLYWNGARANYQGKKDVAMFPPCCNVVFPKVGTNQAGRWLKGNAA
jgi:hypothetical protein